jgi:alginate O-acetyltransferase complex protein AlgI
VALTFTIWTVGLVIFRAATMPQAVGYLGDMFGFTAAPAGSAAAAGVMYTPYHVAVFFVAVMIVWNAPQTWTFTRVLSPARAAVCLVLLAVSIVFMWTQTENPFLYFQF